MSDLSRNFETAAGVLRAQQGPAKVADVFDPSKSMEAAQEAAFSWDIVRDVITWDRHAVRLLGVAHTSQIASGAAFQLRLDADASGARRKALTLAPGCDPVAGVPYRVQYLFHPQGRAHETVLCLEEQGLWWPGDDGLPVYLRGVVRCIQERYAQDERLRLRGDLDPLTGQFNRSRTLEVLQDTIDRSAVEQKPCAFLIAAVNGLDVVNDTFGFVAGDEMLAQVAKLLKRHLRGRDAIGRMASNKFGIVLNDCGPGIMRVIADRMMSAVRNATIETSTVKLAATISVGGVGIQGNSMTAEMATSCSMHALDRARRKRGESFAVYERGQEDEKVRHRNTALANTLLKALEEHRMVLELQPLVSAKTGAAEHYECLLRMITEDGGRVSAGDFMPIAEQLGLSRLVDLRTLELAVDLLKQYRGLKIALNVSGLTSGDNDWLVALHSLTAGSRLLTERLTIEITETAAIQDLDQTMAFVDTIKELGCKAAIDDFGVGYTNFRNLKLLNADLVKIDGAFVKNVCQDKGDQVFIKSMVELAQVFGMKTVAEWVGDEPTATFLTNAGIDYLQGYYFGEPGPPEKFLGQAGA